MGSKSLEMMRIGYVTPQAVQLGLPFASANIGRRYRQRDSEAEGLRKVRRHYD